MVIFPLFSKIEFFEVLETGASHFFELDFEVVLSLLAPIFGLFSEKRSVEGAFSQVQPIV